MRCMNVSQRIRTQTAPPTASRTHKSTGKEGSQRHVDLGMASNYPSWWWSSFLFLAPDSTRTWRGSCHTRRMPSRASKPRTPKKDPVRSAFDTLQHIIDTHDPPD